MLRLGLRFLGIVIVFIAGLSLSYWWQHRQQPTANEQATVLLERIKAVTKLISVEGYFSEVYDYKDYWQFDISPFQKKALLRVKAKVSAGYDLATLQITMQPETKTVVISALPQPTILSIEHDIDYYDITEGTFNNFTPADYNRLNANAKDYIRKRALESSLLESAKTQGDKMLQALQEMIAAAGWTITYVGNANAPTKPLQ